MQLIQVLYLGRLDYGTALRLQQTLVELRKQGRIFDTLLLLEHTPVITLGRNAHRENVLASDEELRRSGIELFEVDRGGDVTYHGPGQLVGYPICDLRAGSPRIGVVEFVRKLEEALIRLCAEHGIPAERIPGRTGVWVPASGSASERKIAAIGIHVSRAVTSHGFALNVTTPPQDFQFIVPCGIADKPVTSIQLELPESSTRSLEIETMAQLFTRQFGNVFGTQILWLESLDALLSAGREAEPSEQEDRSAPGAQDDRLREPEDLRRMREELEKKPLDGVSWA